MLAETAADHCFTNLARRVSPRNNDSSLSWSFHETEEPSSLIATKDAAVLFLIGGRQVVTAEHLEVLLLGTKETFQEGLPIERVLERARSLDVTHVIPWGAGKWLFGRGRVLTRLIDSRATNGFYLGDQGGRPAFWPTPCHLREAQEKGIRILPGSDPLPFPAEATRPGSFGFLMNASIDSSRPAASIKEHLRNPLIGLFPFGRLQGCYQFLCNQLGMQVLKQRRSQVTLRP